MSTPSMPQARAAREAQRAHAARVRAVAERLRQDPSRKPLALDKRTSNLFRHRLSPPDEYSPYWPVEFSPV